MPDIPLVEIAKRWLRAGFSVIPVQGDKKAYQSWKPYQLRPYQLEDVDRAFSDPRAKHVAIVCGYGGVFCFDFDADKNYTAKEPFDLEADFYVPWITAVESLGITPAAQKTQSGGTHVLMLVPEPIGNTKLAQVEAKPDAEGRPQKHAAIETRGKGGYFLIYDAELDPNSLPSITNEQFQTLLEIANDLDRSPQEADAYQGALKKRTTGGQKAHATRGGLVGWFNEQHRVQEILERNRYRPLRGKYLSPDSASGNAGVYLFQDDNGFWMCFSHHADVLGDGRAHDAFDSFKLIEHNGSFEVALGEVRRLKNDREIKGQFNFGAPPPKISFEASTPRVREENLLLASNRGNPVQHATSFDASGLASNGNLASNKDDLTPQKVFDAKGVASKDVASGTKEKAFDASSATASSKKQVASNKPEQMSPSQEIIHAMNPIRRWGERDRPDPVQWLVHNLIQDNAENLLAGEPGVGKSWISGDLAVSVATGTRFLDRHTAQGPVLVINLDDPSESLPRKFAEYTAEGKGYTFDDLPIYYWQPEETLAYPPEGIITPEIFEYLLNQCSIIKPRLIIVDAFSSAFPGLDGNKGQDAIRAFEALRQIRMSAGKPSCMVMLDHTPKATMQDSKRRGVSGSQQKHAKTRTVHIIRKVEPGEVNGDDVLEWEVFKANAAPYQDAFGVDRTVDELWRKASLNVRDLPPSGKSAASNRAAKAAVTYLRGRPGESIPRTDLLQEIIALTNSSKRSAERALNSSDFIDHPGVQKVDLGGRGNPMGFMWVVPEGPSQSFYSKLEALVRGGKWTHETDRLLDAFDKAADGDETKKDKIDEYLSYPFVKEMLAKK